MSNVVDLVPRIRYRAWPLTCRSCGCVNDTENHVEIVRGEPLCEFCYDCEESNRMQLQDGDDP